jgi:PKD repeat protein
MARLALAIALALAVPGGAAADAPKPKKPKLELRASPRTAFSPVSVLFTAELTGGEDIEEYYCPEIEWNWGDGGKSIHESDCAPFESGTQIERRFTATHGYPQAGQYNVKVTFKRSGHTLLSQSVRVTVRAGLGDQTEIEN